MFEEVYYTTILIKTLIDQIKLLIKDKIKGIINIVSDERISKYDFGVLVAEIFGLNKNLIEKGSLENNKSLIKRPRDMSLSTKKLNNYNINFTIPKIINQIYHLLNIENKFNSELIKL
jgi:dTDP-4-dehydrorhamnose reductase